MPRQRASALRYTLACLTLWPASHSGKDRGQRMKYVDQPFFVSGTKLADHRVVPTDVQGQQFHQQPRAFSGQIRSHGTSFPGSYWGICRLMR